MLKLDTKSVHEAFKKATITMAQDCGEAKSMLLHELLKHKTPKTIITSMALLSMMEVAAAIKRSGLDEEFARFDDMNKNQKDEFMDRIVASIGENDLDETRCGDCFMKDQSHGTEALNKELRKLFGDHAVQI